MHYIKTSNNPALLSTKEAKNQKATVEVNTVLLKKMAAAVGIKKGSPSQILQTFLNHALTI